MTTIGFVAAGLTAIVFFVLWLNARDDAREAKKWWKYYEKERRALESQVKDVGCLLEKGWTPFNTCYGSLQMWTFQASDEPKQRRFEEAVTRQRKLDEIAQYSLPKEYETM